jgi:hypothetical protein
MFSSFYTAANTTKKNIPADGKTPTALRRLRLIEPFKGQIIGLDEAK